MRAAASTFLRMRGGSMQTYAIVVWVRGYGCQMDSGNHNARIVQVHAGRGYVNTGVGQVRIRKPCPH